MILHYHFSVLFICLINSFSNAERLYKHQFEPGSEHLSLPSIILFSIYMGKIQYPHLPLLFESMRWNSNVQFTIINIVPNSSYVTHLHVLANRLNVNNLKIFQMNLDEWNKRVNSKLKTNITFTDAWAYKLCDYKPALGYLFDDLATNKFKWWGFVDMDVIWGNITRFAKWFQGGPKDTKFVISGWWKSTGAASFFINEEWTRQFFMQDPYYILLLHNVSYHNLDEGGEQTADEYIFEGGAHAIAQKIDTWAYTHNIPLNKGVNWKDHCFYDEGDCVDWAGPVRWFRGSLQVVHGSPEFPPGRELMFFHRPTKNINVPTNRIDNLFDDMIHFGYLLPTFIPLVSDLMCMPWPNNKISTVELLKEYQPYGYGCSRSW